jgi:hypothetical protein
MGHATMACEGCGRQWVRMLGGEATLDLDALACMEEAEHAMLLGCHGRVRCAREEAVSTVEAVDLLRSRAERDKFERFRRERRWSIGDRAQALGIFPDQAAAIMYAQGERRRKREMAEAPYDVLLGLGSTLVRAGEAANICVRSYTIFRSIRLEVPPDVASWFALTDIKVGKNSQLISPGAIPLSVFVDNRYRYLRLRMDALMISMCFIVSVVNMDKEARNFMGAVVGELPDPVPSRLELMKEYFAMSLYGKYGPGRKEEEP